MHRVEIAGLMPRNINLSDIEEGPGPYCMSFGFDLQPLMRSIRKVGLVNTPLLDQPGMGQFTVVSGFRRIQALRSLGFTRVPCRVMPAGAMSPLQCLNLGLRENLASRTLNDVEKAMVLARLIKLAPKKEILETHMPLLEIHSLEQTLDLYLKIHDQLDPETLKLLAKGRLSLKSAEMLLELEKEERLSVLDVVKKLGLNRNQQIQLIDYAMDLSRMNNKGIPQILGECSREMEGYRDPANRPQRAKIFLKNMRCKRFPTLVGAEAAFKRIVSKLDPPDGVRIIAPPFFESPEFRLEVDFKNGGELREKMDGLSENPYLDELGEPWRLGS